MFFKIAPNVFKSWVPLVKNRLRVNLICLASKRIFDSKDVSEENLFAKLGFEPEMETKKRSFNKHKRFKDC